MAVTLVFSRLGDGRTRVEMRVDGVAQRRYARRLDDEKVVKRLAGLLCVGLTDLREAITLFEREGRSEYTIESVTDELILEVRALRGTDVLSIATRDVLATLVEILSTRYDLVEPVVQWEGVHHLAAVDLDATEGYAWTDRTVEHFLQHFAPRPAFAWRTHGDGLRLLYVQQAGFTAEAIASLACTNLSRLKPYDSLEVKRITRHPLGVKDGCTCGPVHRLQQECDRRALNAWFEWADPGGGEVQRWLEDHQFTRGRKYGHAHCPVQPSTTAQGTPVLVGDHGITCFVCEAHGVTNGASKPGFFPYSALLGRSNAVSHLALLVRNLTHWTHAQHILVQHFQLPPRIVKTAYHAALRTAHPEVDEAFVRLAFLGGRNLVRLDRRWATTTGEVYTGRMDALLRELPAARNPDGSRNDSAVTILMQNHDLTNVGYPALQAIYGCPIWSQHQPLGQYSLTVQLGPLRDESRVDVRPRYTPIDRRTDIDAAWRLIDECCPGVSRRLVELLIVAKGFAEKGVGRPPMIFITGPASAAKTSTVKLAAAILGDRNSDIVVTDVGRTRQAILEASERGSFVTFNEITKVPRGHDVRAAMDLLLNFTPDQLIHKLHVGAVPLSRLPVFCWTDTDIPLEVRADAQLARRLVHVHLPVRVEWDEPLARSIGTVSDIRLAGEPYASACNAILSDAVDRFFRTPTSFTAAALQLGYAPLERGEERESSDEVLKAFFTAVCEAPEITGSDLQRFKRGWRRLERGTTGVLPELWEQLRDPTDTPASRRCSEVDWQRLLGTPEAVLFEVKSSGTNVIFVRFRSADTKRNHRFGMELMERVEHKKPEE